ncbi:MAG TPA: DUF1122 family protein [Dehalococcoidia bacterium]|nr:DUF1122 family protein [Dehalococcoidia bacterium]
MAPRTQPPPLRGTDAARLDALLARGWSRAGPEHPLGRLQGRDLGAWRLLALLGPKNSVGARYFQLYLVDREGRLTKEPLAWGLHNSGPFPGFNWIELSRYDAAPSFDGEAVHLTAKGLDRQLFRYLSEVVPPGGHLMVEYESAGQRESARILGLGYPPAASPLGLLLFEAGCRSFRDWYIPEGGREGPRKLQGFKPLNGAVAAEKTAELRSILAALLAAPEEPQHAEWGRTARRLARAVLETVAGEERAD